MAKTIEIPRATTTTVAPEEQALEKIPPSGELQDSSLMDLMSEDSGGGFAGVGANDFAIPFLAVLQKNSPQVSKANSKYVTYTDEDGKTRGAEAGMFYNTLTQKVYSGDVGIKYIPCGFLKLFVEWISRDSGGGLVASHRPGDPFLKTCGRDDRGRLVPPGTTNIVVETNYHFGIHIPEIELPEWAILSLYSTGLRVSRMWNTTMKRILMDGPRGKFNPPTYSHIYRLKTIPQTKDSYDWFTIAVTSEGRVTDVELYKMARDFSKKVESGDVRVSAPPQDFEAPPDGGGAEDVPF